MPALSVVIPCYNSAQYLGHTIESVLRQTCADHQIIVVDDGSSDHPEIVLDRYRGFVQYVRQENRGCSAARNTALAMVQTPYVAFLDADDFW